jgi:hypothetical protein
MKLRRRKGFTRVGEQKLEPLFHPPFPIGASDNISLGWHPFRGKSPVKELSTLKPVQVKRFTRKARKFLERPEKFPHPLSTLCPVYNIIVPRKEERAY